MLRLLATERGRAGTLRRYQHPSLGVLEIVTVHGADGSADVIHIQHVAEIVRERKRTAASSPPPSRRRGRKPAA
jgi:hypothetical protein